MTRKIFLIVILFLFYKTNIFGCSCDGQSTVKGSVEGSDLVVSGIVLSQTITADLSSFAFAKGDTNDFHFKFMKFPSRVVTLKVFSLFKGKISSDTITIITPVNSASCGVRFEIGKQYIIYGSSEDEITRGQNLIRESSNNNVYWTHSCTRTTQWYQEEDDEIVRVLKNKQ